MSWADQLRAYREDKHPDPALCLACDGTGLDEASGDGWWNQDRCAACGGDGYCVERETEQTMPADIVRELNYRANEADFAAKDFA